MSVTIRNNTKHTVWLGPNAEMPLWAYHEINVPDEALNAWTVKAALTAGYITITPIIEAGAPAPVVVVAPVVVEAAPVIEVAPVVEAAPVDAVKTDEVEEAPVPEPRKRKKQDM